MPCVKMPDSGIPTTAPAYEPEKKGKLNNQSIESSSGLYKGVFSNLCNVVMCIWLQLGFN